MYILSIFPFLQGANELHIVFILNIVLLVLFLNKVIKNKKIILTKDIKFIAICLWSLCYLFTVFYAEDTEFAFLGFIKYLTVPIFLITMMQYEFDKDKKDKWFYAIPQIGAAMVLIILLAKLINMGDIFFYQNRLAGFFNYANSFGLFLLMGIIIIGFREKLKKKDFIMTAFLIIGIVLTNSRAIMIITAFTVLFIMFFNTKKEGNKERLIYAGIIIVSAVLTTFIMKNFGVDNRISQTSGNSSEWLLRILYYKDALRLIADNMFGYGYMAWWYMQEAVQTGAYDAMFVHNGLLQVAVDAGILAAAFIIFVFVYGFFDKKISVRDRVLMVIILGHSLIDFNIEFLAITLVLFMTLNFENKVTVKSVKNGQVVIVGLIIVYAFFAFVTLSVKIGNYGLANKLFPYSLSLSEEIDDTKNYNERLSIARKLYEKNQYFNNALEVLSNEEQAKNNYKQAYEYELMMVKNKKYTMLNYINYVSFLSDAISYSNSMRKEEEVDFYIEELMKVPDLIESVKKSSDELAFKIQHKPRLDIPDEILTYIEQMKAWSSKK